MFAKLSLLNKVSLLVGIGLFFAALWGVTTRHYYNKGWYAGQDALQASVEKRNHDAARHAQEARNEMDKCYDANRDWDQSRGVCITK